MKRVLDALTKAFTDNGVEASCTLYSTKPVVCPLCKADVPAGTLHQCSKEPDRQRLAR